MHLHGAQGSFMAGDGGHEVLVFCAQCFSLAALVAPTDHTQFLLTWPESAFTASQSQNWKPAVTEWRETLLPGALDPGRRVASDQTSSSPQAVPSPSVRPGVSLWRTAPLMRVCGGRQHLDGLLPGDGGDGTSSPSTPPGTTQGRLRVCACVEGRGAAATLPVSFMSRGCTRTICPSAWATADWQLPSENMARNVNARRACGLMVGGRGDCSCPSLFPQTRHQSLLPRQTPPWPWASPKIKPVRWHLCFLSATLTETERGAGGVAEWRSGGVTDGRKMHPMSHQDPVWLIGVAEITALVGFRAFWGKKEKQLFLFGSHFAVWTSFLN